MNAEQKIKLTNQMHALHHWCGGLIGQIVVSIVDYIDSRDKQPEMDGTMLSTSVGVNSQCMAVNGISVVWGGCSVCQAHPELDSEASRS